MRLKSISIIAVVITAAIAALGLLTLPASASTASSPAAAVPAPGHLRIAWKTYTGFMARWHASPGAAGYRVRVARYGKPVREIRTFGKTTSVTVRGLASGGTYDVAVWPRPGGAAHAFMRLTLPMPFGQAAAKYAIRFVGGRYVWGGTTPAGFDCSGLTQYVYRHFGRHLPRTADQQFHAMRRESKSQARPGDLVFFHKTSNPASNVYHVGIDEGGNNMVAAASTRSGIVFQSFLWGGNTVTFGTISH